MTILSDSTLLKMLPELIKSYTDKDLVNPASIDIRLGLNAKFDSPDGLVDVPLCINKKYEVKPHQFVLVETLEHLTVPNGYAVELRLKSTIARMGFNHSLAFWFDPGWDGIGTMEIYNQRMTSLYIYPVMKFAQIIVHKLDKKAVKPYNGKYQGAQLVESAKP